MENNTYKDAVDRFVADIERLSKTPVPASISTIGIGITTHTRANGLPVFKRTLEEIIKHRPPNSRIVVVDDASEYDIMGYAMGAGCDRFHRFSENVGIARAKNKCFELLDDCEHIFLFDDDTFPLIPDWYLPYCTSKENHLMYIFQAFQNGTPCGDMRLLYRDDKISAYNHVRGCMLYYKQACLKAVGGMDSIFCKWGKWGNEHGDLSNRIFNAGLTTFRYMDIPSSKGYFYSGDEHMNVTSTYLGARRMDSLEATLHILERQRNTAVYREYRQKSPVVVSTYYTTVLDPQRGQKWDFHPSKIDDLAQSTRNKNIQLVLLTDVADKPLGDGVTGKHVTASINPYLQRWIHYYQYLREMKDKISWAFLVDATDVEMLNMPDPVLGRIYVGCENSTVENSWLMDNHTDATFKRFYRDYSSFQLLNAGVVGGYVEDLIPFVKAIVDCIADLTTGQICHKQVGPGLTDMALFNMVAYTQFSDKIITGTQVTTEFKANVRNNYSWFKHK
jgi:glycosyltransferase involved in cell wall biosynthesis